MNLARRHLLGTLFLRLLMETEPRPSHAKVSPFAGQREYLHFSVILRPSVLVQSREFNPRPTALQSSAPPTELIQPQLNFSYFLENPAFMYRWNAVALVMAVGLTIGKHSQALNTRLGNTYLHLLGIEADGGGLGKTLAISDTWCSPDFRVLIFRASGVIPRPPDWGFSLRR